MNCKGCDTGEAFRDGYCLRCREEIAGEPVDLFAGCGRFLIVLVAVTATVVSVIQLGYWAGWWKP